MLVTRRLFWVLFAASMLLFLMFFFGGFLLAWLESQVVSRPVNVGPFRPDPDRLIPLIRRGLAILNGSRDTFAYFFVNQGGMVMVTLAFAGAVLVGNDFGFGSVPFYLAKPLSRWHYIGGKCLAVALVVNLITTLPALAIYAQHGLDEWEYVTNPDYFVTYALGTGPASYPLLLAILAFGLVMSVSLSVMLVAAASWARRTLPLVMIWTTVFLFVRLLANMLVNNLEDERWRLLDLWNNLCLLGFACLGYDKEQIFPQPQPEYLEAGLVLAGVCTLCLIYLNLRTRAVEIVK
jgi:hypothetical protein